MMLGVAVKVQTKLDDTLIENSGTIHGGKYGITADFRLTTLK